MPVINLKKYNELSFDDLGDFCYGSSGRGGQHY